MRRLAPLACLLVVACAASDGIWPTLARRPGEVTPMVPRPASGAERPTNVVAPDTPQMAETPRPVPVAIDDVTAQLNTLARDLDDVAARLKQQQGALETATVRARNAAPDSDARGTVEVETTRLERIGGQVADLRDRLDAIAGTLADAAASGTDVTGQIKTAGGLIARTRGLADSVKAAMPAAGARAG